MSGDKLVNAVQTIVSDVNKQCSSQWALQSAAFSRLQILAGLAGSLTADETDYNANVVVSPEKGTGEIFVEVFDLILERGRSHPLFTAMKSADFMDFSATSGNILIHFGVTDLWRKR